MAELTLPGSLAGRGAGAQRPHPGRPALLVHRRAGAVPLPAGPGRGEDHRRAGPGREGLRARPRRRPRARACRRPSRSSCPTSGRSPRSASSTCSSTARGWRSPTRAASSSSTAPTCRSCTSSRRSTPADVHIGCGSRPCGSTTSELGPDPREHQVVPADRRARRRRPHARRGRRHRPRLMARARGWRPAATSPSSRSRSRSRNGEVDDRNEVEMLMPVTGEVLGHGRA